MNALEFPGISQGIAILGSEYCSGYIDNVGKWNTGFYCPSSSSGERGDVFCCGTEHHKYCCTTGGHETPGVQVEQVENVTVMIGVMVGAATAFLLLVIVLCVCCPWCTYYKKRKDTEGCSKAYSSNYAGNIHIIEENTNFNLLKQSPAHLLPNHHNNLGLIHDLPPAYHEHDKYEDYYHDQHVSRQQQQARDPRGVREAQQVSSHDTWHSNIGAMTEPESEDYAWDDDYQSTKF